MSACLQKKQKEERKAKKASAVAAMPAGKAPSSVQDSSHHPWRPSLTSTALTMPISGPYIVNAGPSGATDRLSAVQKKQKEERKAKKASAAAAASAGKAPSSVPDSSGHPWRPFNRETDLGQRPKPSAGSALNKAGSLSSRFG